MKTHLFALVLFLGVGSLITSAATGDPAANNEPTSATGTNIGYVGYRGNDRGYEQNVYRRYIYNVQGVHVPGAAYGITAKTAPTNLTPATTKAPAKTKPSTEAISSSSSH